jgi:hypothetical protein
MPKFTFTSILAASVLAGVMCPTFPAAGGNLDPLQGQWSVTKTNREGERYSQVFEFKQDRIVFRILDANGGVRLYAKGKAKTERVGAFEVLTVFAIEAGRTVDELQSVDDDRVGVYALRGEKLYLASNFDRTRENERPTMDVYVKAEGAREASGGTAPDEDKLLGTWKVEVTYGDNSNDYDLRLGKAEGKLQATLISPRSGEHKFKSVVFQGGELVMELVRQIQEQEATFIYKGKQTAEGLSGTVAVKGMEEQFSGRWKAAK